MKGIIAETDPSAPAIYPAPSEDEINDGPEGFPEIIIDQRDLPPDQLLELYHSSHAFLAPTRSERMGAPLMNALVSGLPSVWTHYCAMIAGADATMGYPLRNYHPMQIYALRHPGGRIPLCAEPEIGGIIEAMEAIYHDYAEATSRAHVAAELMRAWANTTAPSGAGAGSCVTGKVPSAGMMKILWGAGEWKTGDGYGYSIHAKKMKDALLEAGVSIVTDPKDDFDIAVHFGELKPIPKKFNLLLTQAELADPQMWSEKAKRFIETCKNEMSAPPSDTGLESYDTWRGKAKSEGPLKLLWATDRWKTGGAYGYSIHAKKMKDALLEAGVSIVTDPKDDFDIAVHIVPCLEDLNVLKPEDREFAEFNPIPRKPNLLITQVEMTDPQILA